LRLLREAQQGHVETADLVHVIFDVVVWAGGHTGTLVDLIGAVCTHVTVDVQLVVTDSASFVTRSAEILVVCKCTVATLASHQVSSLYPTIDESLVLVSNEYVFIITKVAVRARVHVFAVSATVVAFQAIPIGV